VSTALRLINNSGTYYLIVNNKLSGITSPGLLYSYGFDFSDAKAASGNDLALPADNLLLPGDGYLVKSVKDPTVYLISNRQRHAFTSADVFLALGFSWPSVLLVTDPELQSLPLANNLDNPSSAHLPGLDINDNGTIYWIGSDGKRQGYPDMAVYNSWHKDNDFSNVVMANAADRLLLVSGVVAQRIIQ
jgi:hypothetical protein